MLARRALLPVLALTLLVLPKADAMPAMTRGVPLARLLKNIAAYQKAHPDDPAANYALGRAYYAAFSVPDSETVPLYDEGNPTRLPRFPQGKKIQGAFSRMPTTPGKPTTPELRAKYVGLAIENLRKALGKNEGLAELTLACVLEQGAKYASQVPLPQGETELTTDSKTWPKVAATYYAKAFALAFPKEAAAREQPVFGYQTLLAYEAGDSYLRLATAGNAPARPDIVKGLDALKAKPRSHLVTPLIFSLEREQPLDSLLAPQRTVGFDLDGSGRPQRSPWLQPSTGILVWDPQKTGKITSGTQLFGTATWWMLFPDAYAALDALDDNRDGWLTGKELNGLAVWFDRNQNGISDPGEVVPLAQTPIAAIATKATGKTGLSPQNPHGLRLRDGRPLPTYDWTFLTR